MKNKLLVLTSILCGVLGLQAKESEVSIAVPKDGITLGGTLSVPDGCEPRGAIIMASGSGAQNRDEEILGHKPFKLLSDSLTKAGFIVLRTDDRGVDASSGDLSKTSLDDLCEDIACQYAFIRQTYPDIPIGVLGHSQGGSLAIKTAAKNGCDFIVTLGAPAWQGDSIVMAQSRAMAMAVTGRWDAEAHQRRLLDLAKSELPSTLVVPMLMGAMADAYGDAAKLPQVRQQIELAAKQMTSPSYRDILRYNPAADMAAITVPWLALNGGKDIQVPPGNLTTIRENNPQAHTVELEGHNHLFQECQTGGVDEYARLGQSPSDGTVKVILDWLSQTSFQGKR